VTDPAKALSVSCQAIYDWKAAKPAAAENAERINDILRSSDLFAGRGLKATVQVIAASSLSAKYWNHDWQKGQVLLVKIFGTSAGRCNQKG
jgi:hypothetical protein